MSRRKSNTSAEGQIVVFVVCIVLMSMAIELNIHVAQSHCMPRSIRASTVQTTSSISLLM